MLIKLTYTMQDLHLWKFKQLQYYLMPDFIYAPVVNFLLLFGQWVTS